MNKYPLSVRGFFKGEQRHFKTIESLMDDPVLEFITQAGADEALQTYSKISCYLSLLTSQLL